MSLLLDSIGKITPGVIFGERQSKITPGVIFGFSGLTARWRPDRRASGAITAAASASPSRPRTPRIRLLATTPGVIVTPQPS